MKVVKQWELGKSQLALAYLGSILFSANAFGKIVAWSIGGQGDSKNVFTQHSDAVMKLLPVPDLNILFSGSMDSTINVWDVVSGQLKQTLKGHELGVLHLDWYSEKELLCSGGQDAYVLLWNLEKGKYIAKVSRRFGSSKNNSIIGLQVINQTHELIICDSESVFRVKFVQN